jgi:hypothetical protein
MKYLHSRLALAGVVVAWPLTQLGGCAQKDRNFEPGGTGGDSANGGMAGEDTGATGGKGGTSTGGKGGTSTGGKGGTSTGGTGGSTTGGKGGTSTGGTSGKGGSSTGGTSGKGGTNGGGEAGQIIDPECTPTGVEVCSDGIDNDCDTLTDCLTLVSSFPDENGAAAGPHVNFTFEPKHSSATFECRAVKGTTIAAAEPWGACARASGDTAFPISSAVAVDSANGVWTTEVRLAFPDMSHSRAFRRQVYIHASLNAETPCPALGVDDDAFFTAAAADLEDTGAFDQTTVRNPFVKITFTPPLAGQYYVYAGDGVVWARSLRRRFAFSDDGHFLIMTRTYPSRLSGQTCDQVVTKRVHNSRGTWALGFHSYQTCAAFVMNSNGAGYCLNVGTGNVPVSAEWVRQDYSAQIPDSVYSPRADNFAWRKVFESEQFTGYQTHFSPACEVDGCGDTTTLFLADSGLYTYWAPPPPI